MLFSWDSNSNWNSIASLVFVISLFSLIELFSNIDIDLSQIIIGSLFLVRFLGLGNFFWGNLFVSCLEIIITTTIRMLFNLFPITHPKWSFWSNWDIGQNVAVSCKPLARTPTDLSFQQSCSPICSKTWTTTGYWFQTLLIDLLWQFIEFHTIYEVC